MLTDRLDVLGQHVYQLLLDNQVALGLQDVWYGDQNIAPSTPCAAVETGTKQRTYNGAPKRYQVDLDVYVILYMERIQSTQTNRKEAETLAEDVEAVLHSDWTLGGLAIDSFVESSEPAYVTRGNQRISAIRLTLNVTSQKMLPSENNLNP